MFKLKHVSLRNNVGISAIYGIMWLVSCCDNVSIVACVWIVSCWWYCGSGVMLVILSNLLEISCWCYRVRLIGLVNCAADLMQVSYFYNFTFVLVVCRNNSVKVLVLNLYWEDMFLVSVLFRTGSIFV